MDTDRHTDTHAYLDTHTDTDTPTHTDTHRHTHTHQATQTDTVKEQIYKTLIRPQLEYVSCAWSPWLKQDILELEKVQRRVPRFVYNNYWPMASVTEMISTLNWETLEKRREKARLCMLYKTTINGLIKIPMDHYKSSTFTSTRSFHAWSKFATTQLQN